MLGLEARDKSRASRGPQASRRLDGGDKRWFKDPSSALYPGRASRMLETASVEPEGMLMVRQRILHMRVWTAPHLQPPIKPQPISHLLSISFPSPYHQFRVLNYVHLRLLHFLVAPQPLY